MKERKQFTKEFREGAAGLVSEQGRTIADAAKNLGVSPWSQSQADAGVEGGRPQPDEQQGINIEFYFICLTSSSTAFH